MGLFYPMAAEIATTILVFLPSALGDDLLGDVLGNLHIAVGLHGILAAALGAGTQVSGIAEHWPEAPERPPAARRDGLPGPGSGRGGW